MHLAIPSRPTGHAGRWAAACCLTIALLVGDPGAVSAQACSNQGDAVLRSLAPAAVSLIQSALFDAYPAAPQAAAGRDSFVDGVVGSRTLGLTNRFCSELRVGGEADVAAALQDGIDAFIDVVSEHRDWSSIIGSTAFANWARSLPAEFSLPYYRPGGGGPVPPTSALLISDFLRASPPRAAVSGPWVLTELALEQLATPPQTVQYRVAEASVARLTAGRADPELIAAIDALRGLPVGTRAEALAQVATVFESFRAAPDPDPAPAPDTVPPTGPRFPPAESFAGRVSIEETEPLPALTGPEISPSVLAELATLIGIRFPTEYLFREAVRLTAGVGPASPEVLRRILAATRPSGGAPVIRDIRLKPIEWKGSSCGCGAFVKSSDEFPTYLYGMYPFWAAPQEADTTDRATAEPTVIDFSLLTRVGYFGLTFDESGAITDPLHWKKGAYPEEAFFWQRSDFSDFIQTAHQHKTGVDVVIYNGDWSAWLPQPGASLDDSTAVRQRNAARLATLTQSIDSLITPKLDGVIEFIKPIISLGQSPRRTLGDGVVLDFDFEGVSRQDQAWVFDVMAEAGFFTGLRDRLNESGRSRDTDLLNLDPEYSLNLIVPAYCLAGAATDPARMGCGFYTVPNLNEIEAHLDLIIIDFGKESSQGSPSAAGLSPLALAEGLHDGLEALPVDRQIAFLRKTVPLVQARADDLPLLDPLFQYSDWHFSGIGLWSAPVDEVINTRVRDTFLETRAVPSGKGLGATAYRVIVTPALALEARICRVSCPLRWPLRTLVFLTLVVGVGHWTLSTWKYDWKRVYEMRWFAVVRGVVIAGFFLTLWCDPYWKLRQSAILFFFLGGLMIYSAVHRVRRTRERDYP